MPILYDRLPSENQARQKVGRSLNWAIFISFAGHFVKFSATVQGDM